MSLLTIGVRCFDLSMFFTNFASLFDKGTVDLRVAAIPFDKKYHQY